MIYGSAARQDDDIYSDKDMLIVSNRINEHINNLARAHEAIGWNCAIYTFNQLKSLANSGSLFIQHLRQDGIKIRDKCGKLTHIISSFSAKTSYTDDILSAKKFFEALKYVEFSPLGILWALDVIIVGLRNYSILTSAQNNLYEFSYKNLIINFSATANLTHDEKEILLSLRKYKHIFRNNIDHNKCETDLLYNIIDILNRKYKFNICTNLVNHDAFFLEQLKNINNGHFSGYQKLRMCESLFLSTKNFISKDDQLLFYNIIKKPRQCYCFNDKEFINNLIQKINTKYCCTHLI